MTDRNTIKADSHSRDDSRRKNKTPQGDYRKDRVPEYADQQPKDCNTRSGDDWDERPYASSRGTPKASNHKGA